MSKLRVLATDDDPHIREALRFALDNGGYEVILAHNGEVALEKVRDQTPSLVILDILMPDMNGIDVCREIRKLSDVPVIFLTSKDDEIDRIVGLEIGADDYVTKPFSPRELLARIGAVLRRYRGSESLKTGLNNDPASANIMTHGSLVMDLDQVRAYWNKREVVLTRTEFAILRTMLNHPGKVFSRDELMDGAYPGGEIVSDRTIDSHVRRVRSKFGELGADPVETVHGLGYRLGDC
jgi:two-component system OmpR family response regulator